MLSLAPARSAQDWRRLGARGNVRIWSVPSTSSTITRVVPRSAKPELHRRGVRQVDQPLGVERPSIVDAHDRAPLVVEVRDAHVRRYRQAAVRRGQLVHVVQLTARRSPAVEFRAVPRRLAVFPVVPGIRQHVVRLAQYFIRTLVAVSARRFGARNRIRQIAEVRRLADGSAIAGRERVGWRGRDATTRTSGASHAMNASRARGRTSLANRTGGCIRSSGLATAVRHVELHGDFGRATRDRLTRVDGRRARTCCCGCTA